MDPMLHNRVSQIIEIEDDVIDLDDTEKTPEEVIYEWDAKIRKKLSMFAVADNENILGDLMKEYLESLQEMIRSYEDNKTLKNKVFCHISFLYSYYVELQCCIVPDNYLSNMEDILTLYCNLELEVVRPLKRKDSSEYKKRVVSVARHIIHVLTVYLLERHDHILHVLIKMNTNKVSDSCSEVLNILYMHFLTKVPAFNLCDESFCRNYILFQKWKEIRKVEEWEDMDKIMYKMFKRTPESIKNNETLRQILMPACSSTVDIVLNLFRSFRAISSAYFKHVVAKKNIDMDDLVFNIDLGEDEPTIALDDENEEEVQFLKAYYEVERNMLDLSHVTNTSDIAEIDIFRKCKEEFDEDDDVQFVGITMLPKQPVREFSINDEDSDYHMNNAIPKRHTEADRISTPLLLSTAKNKNPDLENLNGMSRMRIESPKPLPETSNSCQSTEIQSAAEPQDPILPSVEETVATCDITPENNQPKVSFVSNNVQVPSPSPATVLEDTTHTKRTVETKSVEVQADNIKNYLYNDYGLTTPPFDVQTDEQVSRSVESCIYTDIGQSHKETRKADVEKSTRSVEVQVEPPSSSKNCLYNDYGLTPPNDTHLEDPSARLQEPLYTNIGQKDLSNSKIERNFSDAQIGTDINEVPQINDAAQESVLETENHIGEFSPNSLLNHFEPNCPEPPIEAPIQHDSFDEFEDHLDMPEINEDEEIDVESCQDIDKSAACDETGHAVHDQNSHVVEESTSHEETDVATSTPEESTSGSKTSNPIDTGQKAIPDSAPNIEELVTAETEIRDLTETYNGNTVLKPLVTSNRTNGQSKDNTKIMYTSSQKIRPTSLDDFSRFENAINSQWNKMKENHEFDDILSGPVTKLVPTKQNNLLNSPDKLDLFNPEVAPKPVVNSNSRSNSPNDMTSPDYEAIDDFRNYYSDSVNGRVPPPHDVRVPPGILKKTNSTRKKNQRIMFHESTCDNSEERKPRSDGVLVLKRVRRDKRLNMEPRVIVKRLSFIENKVKKVLNNPPTLRVDYDKTTPHISEKDVVRCVSPPRISWVVNLSTSRQNPGSTTVKNREHLEKKPKKRKLEPQNNSISEPVIRRKRAFRTPKKKTLAVKEDRGGRKRKKTSSTENTFVSKSDSEFDKLLNSGAYSNKPFRLDLTS